MDADTSVPSELQAFAADVAATLRDGCHCELAPRAEDYRWLATEGAPQRFEVVLKLGRNLVRMHGRWPDGGTTDDDYPDTRDRLAGVLAHMYDQDRKFRPVPGLVRRRTAELIDAGAPCRLVSLEQPPFDLDFRGFPSFTVELERIDSSLRLTIDRREIGDKWYVDYMFDELERTQPFRMRMREHLAKFGGTAAIESALLRSMRLAGVADADLLRAMRLSDSDNFEVAAPGGNVFRLHWSDGCVTGWVELEDGASWNGGTLFLKNSPRAIHKRCFGRPLEDVYRHELLDPRVVIRSGWGRKGGAAQLRCSYMMAPLHLEDERFV